MSGPGLETAPLMGALVLNCAGVNFALILSNIWTWLAVVTAAVGLWRIRSFKPDTGPDRPICQSIVNSVDENPVRVKNEERAAAGPEPDRPGPKSAREDESASERVTKGNMYKEYYYAMHAEAEEEGENGGGWAGGDAAVVKEWSCGLSPAAEGMGWYGYQDTGVLDGSVVRLWDHARGGGCWRRLAGHVGVTR